MAIRLSAVPSYEETRALLAQRSPRVAPPRRRVRLAVLLAQPLSFRDDRDQMYVRHTRAVGSGDLLVPLRGQLAAELAVARVASHLARSSSAVVAARELVALWVAFCRDRRRYAAPWAAPARTALAAQGGHGASGGAPAQATSPAARRSSGARGGATAGHRQAAPLVVQGGDGAGDGAAAQSCSAATPVHVVAVPDTGEAVVTVMACVSAWPPPEGPVRTAAATADASSTGLAADAGQERRLAAARRNSLRRGDELRVRRQLAAQRLAVERRAAAIARVDAARAAAVACAAAGAVAAVRRGGARVAVAATRAHVAVGDRRPFCDGPTPAMVRGSGAGSGPLTGDGDTSGERLRAGAEVVATVVRTALGVVVRVKRAREASDEGGSRVVRARLVGTIARDDVTRGRGRGES